MVVLGAQPYHMSPFIVGKWNIKTKTFDFFDDKIKDLNSRCSTTMEHCKICPVKFHCGGYCLGETVNETGRLDGQNLVKCAAVRRLYKELGPCAPYHYLHP